MPKVFYSQNNYIWFNETLGQTKYNINSTSEFFDNKTILDLEDDAARANLGGAWCTPTLANIQ